MEPMVRLEAASKRYETAGPPALDGATMQVATGEAVAVMGPSGSGKSTLLNLVAGLDRPTSGTVEVGGVVLNRLSEKRLAQFRRAQVGIVFQFFHLLDELTVRDNVLLPAQLAGARPATARVRTNELLEALGIERFANTYPARLSGGQRQRVAIARALVNRPGLLLADEPTGAVDAATGADVIRLLRDIAASGQTLVLVTHDSRLAQASTQRVVELYDGRVLQPAPVEVRS